MQKKAAEGISTADEKIATDIQLFLTGGQVSDFPLSCGPSPMIYGTATRLHSTGFGAVSTSSGEHERSIEVSMLPPGSSVTAAIPSGNSAANDCVNPSMANFEAQYGDKNASPCLPQYELILTTTPPFAR